MSNFLLNKYVAIKKYNCYKRNTIKDIEKKSKNTWDVRKRDVGAAPWRQRWNIWFWKPGLEVTFSSENEAKNPEIAAEYLGQI